MNITINRYSTASRMLVGGGLELGLGELIDSTEWGSDVLPRNGDLITVHPEGYIADESWTGTVTGVQHVYSAGSPPRIIVTVREQ